MPRLLLFALGAAGFTLGTSAAALQQIDIPCTSLDLSTEIHGAPPLVDEWTGCSQGLAAVSIDAGGEVADVQTSAIFMAHGFQTSQQAEIGGTGLVSGASLESNATGQFVVPNSQYPTSVIQLVLTHATGGQEDFADFLVTLTDNAEVPPVVHVFSPGEVGVNELDLVGGVIHDVELYAELHASSPATHTQDVTVDIVILPACGDGRDNDGDGRIDFDPLTYADPNQGNGDLGCRQAAGSVENTQCQDGADNDGDDGIDFDGGQSIHGACTPGPGGCPAGVSDPDDNGIADPDPQCAAPTSLGEGGAPSGSCGLGWELTLLLAPWLALQRRRRA